MDIIQPLLLPLIDGQSEAWRVNGVAQASAATPGHLGCLSPPRKDKVQLSISVLFFQQTLYTVCFCNINFANILDSCHFLQGN